MVGQLAELLSATERRLILASLVILDTLGQQIPG